VTTDDVWYARTRSQTTANLNDDTDSAVQKNTTTRMSARYIGSARCICFGRRAGNRDVGLDTFILALVDYSSQKGCRGAVEAPFEMDIKKSLGSGVEEKQKK
jgi:hypothetical protein